MAKLFATEVAEEAAIEAMRIHGGYGYSQEYPIERLYRDAPVLILGEGSNEIQQLLIARRILERYGNGASFVSIQNSCAFEAARRRWRRPRRLAQRRCASAPASWPNPTGGTSRCPRTSESRH